MINETVIQWRVGDVGVAHPQSAVEIVTLVQIRSTTVDIIPQNPYLIDLIKKNC